MLLADSRIVFKVKASIIGILELALLIILGGLLTLVFTVLHRNEI